MAQEDGKREAAENGAPVPGEERSLEKISGGDDASESKDDVKNEKGFDGVGGPAEADDESKYPHGLPLIALTGWLTAYNSCRTFKSPLFEICLLKSFIC